MTVQVKNFKMKKVGHYFLIILLFYYLLFLLVSDIVENALLLVLWINNLISNYCTSLT